MRSPLLILLACLLAFGACKKDSNDNDNDPITSDAQFYFVGKLDDQEFRIEATPTGDIQAYYSTGGADGGDHCVFDYGAYLESINPGEFPSAGVDFIQYFDGDCSTEFDVFNSLFPTGVHAFASDPSAKGAIVGFQDATGTYSTANGTQPAGAEFKITKTESTNDPFFGPGQTITGTVTCTLYDDQGNKKELTEGSFRLDLRAD